MTERRIMRDSENSANPHQPGRLERPATDPTTGRFPTLILGSSSIFHTGLAVTLREATEIDVIGEWDCSIRDFEPHRIGRARVALVDLDAWGVETIRRLQAPRPTSSGVTIEVIAVTRSLDAEFAAQALSAGARGLLLKSAEPEDFVAAVQAVANGDVVLAPHVVAWLLDEKLNQTRSSGPLGVIPGGLPDCSDMTLTPRQQQILSLLASGLSNAEIADQLNVSKPTVKSHVSALLRTFNVRDRTQLALLANQRQPA